MTREEINISIEKNELQLKKWQRFTHFEIVFGLFFLSMLSTFIFFYKSQMSELEKIVLLFSVFFWMALAIGSYFMQKKRLRFKWVETNLSEEEILEVLKIVEEKLKWQHKILDKNHYVAVTNPSFFSGSWGELITIIFKNNQIFINSICNPFDKSSIISMGRNKRNENIFIKHIQKASH